MPDIKDHDMKRTFRRVKNKQRGAISEANAQQELQQDHEKAHTRPLSLHLPRTHG